MAQTEKAEGAVAGNSYQMTCGPVRARFDAQPLPEALTRRLAAAATANARTGGALAPGATPEAVQPPMPDLALLGDQRTSVACDVVFDLGADGVAQAIAPRCSDTAFDALAASAISAARFKPVLKAGQPVAHQAIIYPIDFCFND